MRHTLVYTKTAHKDIKKLDSIVKKRLKKKIEEYAEDPISNARKLVNSSIGMYRWRIGNYRVIFDIENNNIIILTVGHRREIYK